MVFCIIYKSINVDDLIHQRKVERTKIEYNRRTSDMKREQK